VLQQHLILKEQHAGLILYRSDFHVVSQIFSELPQRVVSCRKWLEEFKLEHCSHHLAAHLPADPTSSGK
jgi:hypothetical protein